MLIDKDIVDFGILYPYQQDHCLKICKALHKHKAALDASDTGTGKCHGKGTQIILFDGSFKKVEDISPGDLLMGDDSTPRKVLSITSGVDDMYKITPNRGGEPFFCNKAHILCLKQYERDTNYHKSKKIVEISIENYLKLTKTRKHYLKLYRASIKFPSQSVLIDPYWLGLWLADGTHNTTTITTPDKEIVDFIYEYAEKMNLDVIIKEYRQPNKSKGYKLRKRSGNNNHLLDKMRRYKIVGNKHIPHQYIQNSQEIRKRLLAGLLDGDGYKYNNGSYEITQKRNELANQIVFLARSLGYMVSLKRKKKKGFGIEGIYNVIHISAAYDLPNKVKRKITTEPRKQKKRPYITGFKIEYIGKDEYFGFTLDGNGRYLLKDTTVTHNTLVALQAAKILRLNPIVICPKAVVPGWKRWLDKFGFDYIIANYELMRVGKMLTWRQSKARRRNKITDELENYMIEKKVKCPRIDVMKNPKPVGPKKTFYWNAKPDDLFIFDEVHRCKHWDTINTQLLVSLRKGAYCLMLSATVAENPLRMYGIGTQLGWFNYFGQFFKWVQKYGCRKVEVNRKTHTKAWKFMGGRGYIVQLHNEIFGKGLGARMDVSKLIKEGKFPTSTNYIEEYDFHSNQREIERIYGLMIDELKTHQNALEMVSRGLSLEFSELVFRQKQCQEVELLKVPVMTEMAEDFISEGRSVVIMVNFTATLKAFCDKLETDCTIYGGNSAAVNEQNRQRFERNEARVIICNIKAAKEGIDLHDKYQKHPRVSLITPTDSAQDLKQAMGRVWRAGGSPSFQYIICATNTVEGKVMDNVMAKIKNISALNTGKVEKAFKKETLNRSNFRSIKLPVLTEKELEAF